MNYNSYYPFPPYRSYYPPMTNVVWVPMVYVAPRGEYAYFMECVTEKMAMGYPLSEAQVICEGYSGIPY